MLHPYFHCSPTRRWPHSSAPSDSSPPSLMSYLPLFLILPCGCRTSLIRLRRCSVHPHPRRSSRPLRAEFVAYPPLLSRPSNPLSIRELFLSHPFPVANGLRGRCPRRPARARSPLWLRWPMGRDAPTGGHSGPPDGFPALRPHEWSLA